MRTFRLSPRVRKSFVIKIILALFSGVLIGLTFLYGELFILAWIGFIPLLVALQNVTPLKSYILGLACGISLSAVASYWMLEFIHNLKGYAYPLSLVLSVLVWIYSGHLLACVALLYAWIRRKLDMSDYLVFPTLITVFFAAYPLMFSNQLGATQSHFLLALQATEYTGVYGLDFIIALTNVALCKLFFLHHNSRGTGLAFGLTLCWFAYGVVTLTDQWHKESTWNRKKIGIVQPNDAPSIGVPEPKQGYSLAYPQEMAMTELLANHGAEVVIWPEARFKGYFANPHVADSFRYQAHKLNTAFIFQDVERIVESGQVKKFNTSVMIDAQGQEKAFYRKRKLVAFGEYLPVFSDHLWAKSFLRKIFGDFFSDFHHGDMQSLFQVADVRLVPMICYEIMFPRFVARALPQQMHNTVLLVQSSNAWFGRTPQPFQHVGASVLRSVELRLPLVHVMNNGPSVVILPSGRRVFESAYGQPGGYITSIPLSVGLKGSFFSRYPNAFIYGVYSLFILLVAARLAYPLHSAGALAGKHS